VSTKMSDREKWVGHSFFRHPTRSQTAARTRRGALDRVLEEHQRGNGNLRHLRPLRIAQSMALDPTLRALERAVTPHVTQRASITLVRASSHRTAVSSQAFS
jgi:hypothetical protein